MRAVFYREWGPNLTPAGTKTARKLAKKTWWEAETVADVLVQIAALMSAKTETIAATGE